MAVKEDYIIGLLVTKLTGLKENTKEWNKVVSKSKYNLSYYKFTSTSENQVNTSYSNLADKFRIKGHVEFANELLQKKNTFLDASKEISSDKAIQNILKYDMLRLLLSLSSSQNQSFDFISNDNQQRIQNNNISWNELVKEEPLEGDHWKTWSDYSDTESAASNDGDSDKEQFELDRDQLQKQYNNNNNSSSDNVIQPKLQKADYIEQMELDTRQDNNALEYLVSQQYWREQRDDIVPEDTQVNGSILYHPLQLNSALYHHEEMKQHIKLLNEADVIREVLFLLKGCEGVLFKYDENEDHFILDENYMVQHLSQHSLSSLLNEFCNYGNMISDLRVIVTRIANRIQFGQTSQAFATAVVKLLFDFELQLSKLETDNRFTTADPSKIISLLKLRNTLDPTLQMFDEMHNIAISIPFDNQMNVNSYLLSVIYERTLIAQSSEQLHIYTNLLNIFEQTMAPIGRMMDEWMFYGSLDIDKANEFYVKRQLDIQKDEMDFWKKGYFLTQVDQTEGCFKCPLFDAHVMERVFFTGKAIDLLTRMKKLPTDMTPSFFSDTISKCLADQNDEPLEILSDDEQVNGMELITIDDDIQDAEQIVLDCEDRGIDAELAVPERQERKHNAFTRALFPLLGPSPTINKIEDKRMEPSTIGVLFDQVFIQAVEKYIEKPYHQVANHLNKVLHQECALDQQLKTLASVYLMLENDLMHSFCESLFIQMDKQAHWFDEIILNRIYLEACELSGYKEIVYIHIDDNSSKAKDMTSCLSLVRFNVQINWPLNNFVQSSNLEEYTKITSFLMRLKRSKYVLEKRTLLFGRERSSSGRNTMRFYSIRIKMLWFVNAFWRYIMTTVLHVETLRFYDNLSKSKDADEITALHSAYVRRIVDYCLLNNKAVSIKKSIIQIMDLTEKMGDLFKQFMITKEHDDTTFNDELDMIEKEFDAANKFITASLNILGKKTNLPWLESLASSLSAQ